MLPVDQKPQRLQLRKIEVQDLGIFDHTFGVSIIDSKTTYVRNQILYERFGVKAPPDSFDIWPIIIGHTIAFILILSFSIALPISFVIASTTLAKILPFSVPTGLAILIARRMRIRDMYSALSHYDFDARPPILYLRSFVDDSLTLRVGITGIAKRLYVLRYAGFGTRVGLEEEITGQLSKYGPTIAIHRQGDRLKALGASRAYLYDETWRRTATRWIEDSKLICLLLGQTKGLNWEIQKILEGDNQSKTVFVFPPKYGLFYGTLMGKNRKRVRAWSNFKKLCNASDRVQKMKLPNGALTCIIVDYETLKIITRKRRFKRPPTSFDYLRALKASIYVAISHASKESVHHE